MMKRRKTNTGICILLLLSIFIIEGCSLERTVNGSFCKRQYTPGVFIDNPAKKKDVSSNSITTCKKNEPAMTQAVAIRNQVVAGKKTQLVAELKRMAINTAKENIAGKHNTFFVPVLSKKNVTINGIKNSLNTNENPVLAPNSKPWKWYRIVGVTLALLGFIVFFTVGFIGPAVSFIGIILILKARVVKLTVDDSKDEIKGSLGLKGVTMELLAALFTWLVTLPVGLGYFSMYPWLINLALVVAAAVFVAGLVMCIIALIHHETFHEFAKYGIYVLLYIVGFVVLALLLLLLLG